MPFDLRFVKEHPVETGAAVFVGGALLLYMLGFFGGGSSNNSGAALDAAYLQAQSAEAQSGNALQAVQIQTQGATQQDLINANASIINNQTWASTQLSETQSNNAAATAVAPYAVQNNLISTLGQVASIPPTVATNTVTTGGSSGFFGIGAKGPSTYQTTTVTPNAAAADASNILNEFANGFFASH